MTQTLPRPLCSAARAHSVARPGTPWPISARPRLSVQPQSIRLVEHGEETIKVAVGHRHGWQPRARRARVLEAAGRQDDDDRLLSIERAACDELHDRRQRRRRRGFDVQALFAGERALGFEHALVGHSHPGAARLPQRGEPLPRPVARGDRERDGWRRRLDRRSEEHTSELQSRLHLVCRLLLEKKKKTNNSTCFRKKKKKQKK